MAHQSRFPSSKACGYSRLAVEAIVGLTDVVEAMHHTISQSPGILGRAPQGRTSGITGFVYESTRQISRWVGSGVELSLGQLAPDTSGESSCSPVNEAVIAAINGVLGDYLAETQNPLAIPMQFRRNGRALRLEPDALAAALEQPNGKILIMAHGHCMNDLFWGQTGHDHGAALAADLGFTPIYLRYNSGRHISTNGREFAGLMETLLGIWPVAIEDVAIVAHSLGGLVSRSACHYGELAGHQWPRRVGKIVYLGTPHHGAPLERAGNWLTLALGVSPYSKPLSRLAKIRGACITDMRYGTILDSHWESCDRFEHVEAPGAAVPLHESIRHFAIAASLGKQNRGWSGRLIGDGLVPLDSALGRHASPELTLPIPEDHQWIGYGMGHLELLHRAEVYEAIRRFLSS
ncbi:MAG: alpha/beta hydrolase [Candidatus Schekmanbacteria bacterium]|nr:alpha/beta hydrolase [Candidatus Schekmanbacteria bacterium]